MGIPGLSLCFVGSIALAIGEMTLVARLFGPPGPPFVACFIPTLIVVGLAAYKLVDCPRCGVSAYWHSGKRWSNAWPEKHCSKCDLDLRRFHPFDSRAKRGT
jgi:hypothetical protein